MIERLILVAAAMFAGFFLAVFIGLLLRLAEAESMREEEEARRREDER